MPPLQNVADGENMEIQEESTEKVHQTAYTEVVTDRLIGRSGEATENFRVKGGVYLS